MVGALPACWCSLGSNVSILRLKRPWYRSVSQSPPVLLWPASMDGLATWRGLWRHKHTRQARTSLQSKCLGNVPTMVPALVLLCANVHFSDLLHLSSLPSLFSLWVKNNIYRSDDSDVCLNPSAGLQSEFSPGQPWLHREALSGAGMVSTFASWPTRQMCDQSSGLGVAEIIEVTRKMLMNMRMYRTHCKLLI